MLKGFLMRKFLAIAMLLTGCMGNKNQEPLYNCYGLKWHLKSRDSLVIVPDVYKVQSKAYQNITKAESEYIVEQQIEHLSMQYQMYAMGPGDCSNTRDNNLICDNDKQSYFCLPIEYNEDFAKDFVEQNIEVKGNIKMFPLDNN